MKIKSRRGEPLPYNGVLYQPDEYGYVEMPEETAVRAGFVKRKTLTRAEEKEPLVERAIELEIDSPSSLQRWGVDRLKVAIEEAEQGAPPPTEGQGSHDFGALDVQETEE